MQPGNRHQQYYEISPSPVDSLQHQHQHQHQQQTPSNTPDAGPTPHLHPIGLCAIPAGEIIPGTVFGDPNMGHLHYHIYPSRRALEPRGHYQRPEVKERVLELHDSQVREKKIAVQLADEKLAGMGRDEMRCDRVLSSCKAHQTIPTRLIIVYAGEKGEERKREIFHLLLDRSRRRGTTVVVACVFLSFRGPRTA